MQTHFIQIDHPRLRGPVVLILTAQELAQQYGPDQIAALARGETIRIGERLHLDLQAFAAVNRTLPPDLARAAAALDQRHHRQTRRPTFVANLAARRGGFPQLRGA